MFGATKISPIIYSVPAITIQYFDTTVAGNHSYMNNEAEDATLEWCREIGCKFIEDAIHKLVARYGERLQRLTRNRVTKT